MGLGGSAGEVSRGSKVSWGRGPRPTKPYLFCRFLFKTLLQPLPYPGRTYLFRVPYYDFLLFVLKGGFVEPRKLEHGFRRISARIPFSLP